MDMMELNGDPELITGKFSKALRFDGAGDFVDCGNAESLNLGAFTVAFWANMPQTQGWNYMVSKGSHVGWGAPGSLNWGVMVYCQSSIYSLSVCLLPTRKKVFLLSRLLEPRCKAI